MALIEGVQAAATDRQANVEKLRALTRRATGRETVFTSAESAPFDGADGTDETDRTDGTDEAGESNKTGEALIEDDALINRVQQLVRAHDRNMAEQLALYREIDHRELWRKVGCRDCVHWMDRELGISRNAAYERLRAARALCSLPVIESLFALGKLSWSKLRELTRVATPANEQGLTAAALELSASETAQLCQRWRHAGAEPGTEQHTDSHDEREAAQALQAWRNRSLSWRSLPGNHTIRITIDLPVDSAAEFLKALEAMEALGGSDTPEAPHSPEAPEAGNTEQPEDQPSADIVTRTPAQRRIDALLLMSTKALAHAGTAVATSDRYRVLVTLDSRLLGVDAEAYRTVPGELPPERPAIQGFGPLAVATAQRLASQARLTIVATDAEGEVVACGRDTRLFSPSTFRALIARDRCCQMPGCTQSRTGWLHAHHVIPWTAGGEFPSGDSGRAVLPHRRKLNTMYSINPQTLHPEKT